MQIRQLQRTMFLLLSAPADMGLKLLLADLHHRCTVLYALLYVRLACAQYKAGGLPVTVV